jgi:hypothetical protein
LLLLKSAINGCANLPAGSITFDRLPLFGYFVTDDAANDSATHGSGRTATGQHGTADGADAGADSCTLPLRRHAATGAQTEHGCHDNCVEQDSLHGFHGTNSFENSYLTPEMASVITC